MRSQRHRVSAARLNGTVRVRPQVSVLCRGQGIRPSRAVASSSTFFRKYASRMSYCQKWCLTIDSSGGLVDVGHFDSIVEFHPRNHLGPIMESS